jgi:hypothetical protein
VPTRVLARRPRPPARPDRRAVRPLTPGTVRGWTACARC